MKLNKSCLLIGDSNFINKKTNSDNALNNFCLGELVAQNLKIENYEVINISKWGESLLDVYKRIIIESCYPNCNPDFIFLGLGTNDSNYYLSSNNFIFSSELHKELLNGLIKNLLKIYPNSEIILLQIPKIFSKNNEINLKRNEQIDIFNKIRNNLSKLYGNKVIFLNLLYFDPDKHLLQDGIHINFLGLNYISDMITEYILEKSSQK